VRVAGDGVEYRLASGDALAFVHCGAAVHLSSGQPVARKELA
jgi:hypothetical protein